MGRRTLTGLLAAAAAVAFEPTETCTDRDNMQFEAEGRTYSCAAVVGRDAAVCDTQLCPACGPLRHTCDKTCGHCVPGGPARPALADGDKATFWTSDLHELGRHDVPSVLSALGHDVFQASRKGCVRSSHPGVLRRPGMR